VDVLLDWLVDVGLTNSSSAAEFEPRCDRNP
jgi:hypothetical protein